MAKIVYKYSFLISAFLILSITSKPSFAQEPSTFFSGFGIEVGAGYNQLFWEATDFEGNKVNANRTAFSIMPSARISYDFNTFGKVKVYSFVGYNEFGGYSELKGSDAFLNPDVRYQDQIKFQNLELGAFGTYPILKISVGIGMKVNYHLDTQLRHYYENHPQGQNGWSTIDNSFFFNKWSLDAGIRLDYPIFQRFSLGTEGWFGLTDLAKDSYPIFVRENHFRIMLGLKF